MSNPDKSGRQNMLREEIQEIQDIHGHNPMFATIPVHFVVVRDLGIVHVENPGIGDGDPEGISGDVFEHQIDAFGRRSGVDDPVLVKALFSDVLFNDQIQFLESCGNQCHEPSPELSAQGSHGKQEVTVLTPLEDLPSSRVVNSPSRHNTMDMWMVEEIGTPGMENGSHSAPDSFMMSEGLDGLPGGLEHGIVEDGLMCHRKGIETGRERKDDMKVFRRDDLFLAKIDPLFPLLVLALGAMSVTAAVVADFQFPALWTRLDMSTQSLGSAECQMTEGLSDRCYDQVFTEEFRSVFPDDLPDVEGGSHFLGGKSVSISRTCLAGSMSATCR